MKKFLFLFSSLFSLCLMVAHTGKASFVDSSCDREPVTSLPKEIHFSFEESLLIPAEEGGKDLSGTGGDVHCSFTIGASDRDHQIEARASYKSTWTQDPQGRNVEWESVSSGGFGLDGVLWCNASDSSGNPITVGMLKAALAPQIRLETNPPDCQ